MMLKRNFPACYYLKATGGDRSNPESIKASEGQLYTEPVFSSTSMEQDWSSSYSNSVKIAGTMEFNIRAPKGTQGLRYGGGEAEVILPRGMTYVVRSCTMTNKGHYPDQDHYVANVDVISDGKKVA